MPLGLIKVMLRKALCCFYGVVFFSGLSFAYGEFQPKIYRSDQDLGTKGYRLGKLRAHAVLGFLHSYDTNVLFANSDKEGGFVFELIPGIDLERSTRRYNFLASYRYKLREYWSSSIQDNGAHYASFEGKWQFTSRLALSLRNVFDQSSDPASIEVQERLEHWRNLSTIELSHTTPAMDLRTSLGYQFTYQKFNSNADILPFYDDKRHRISTIRLTSRFYFLPRSNLFFNGNYGFSTFDNEFSGPPNNFDSNSYGIEGGINTLFTKKLGMTVRLGYQFRDFDEGADGKNVVGGVEVYYINSSKTNFSARYERNSVTSVFTNYYVQDRIFFKLKHRFSQRVWGAFKQEFSFVDFSGPTQSIGLVDREDFVLRSQVQLNYFLKKWLNVLVQYEYFQRNSTGSNPFTGEDNASFDKNIYTLGLELYY